MHRRGFVRSLAAGTVLANAPALAGTGDASAVARADWLFFDERFDAARLHAARLGTGRVPIAVRGDITPILGRLSRDSRAPRPILHGVTTESFWFCLAVTLDVLGSTHTRIARIDRDLHLWSILPVPRPDAGRAA